MKTTDPSHNNFPGDDWQLLEGFDLPVGSNAEDFINTRLTKILEPLNLHADFLNKILKSAQDVAVRVLQAEAEMKFEHIHILVLVPSDHTSKGGTWGFFRVEKIENTAEGNVAHGHTIEFYLYVEGE